MGRFKDIMIFLVSMLFPNRCIFCNEPIDPFDDYCDNCAVNVPFIKVAALPAPIVFVTKGSRFITRRSPPLYTTTEM